MVGIIGNGHVGGAMKKLFEDAVVYDKYKGYITREQINECDIAFVCVPTPMADDGHCDTTAVDEVLDWCATKVIVIRSTVPVGYTERKKKELGKRIVFQPEYYGETHHHPLADLRNRTWITLGGSAEDTTEVVKEYQKVYTADVEIVKTDASTAELAKYMENCFYATKVTFCNEMYDIAKKCGVDYDELREVWLKDPRISRSHTFVYEDNRGYGGSCLPKDIAALAYISEECGVNHDLLDAVIKKNNYVKGNAYGD